MSHISAQEDYRLTEYCRTEIHTHHQCNRQTDGQRDRYVDTGSRNTAGMKYITQHSVNFDFHMSFMVLVLPQSLSADRVA